MKKYIYILLVAALSFSSCHQPEYVAPTAQRQGLTSLTAILVEGPYAGQELGRLAVTDPDAILLEIPIPYYYPEASNDETLIYMMKLRVQAELQPNYKITPTLGVMDLTEVNTYTLTDPDGNSREIQITGKRVKPAACSLLSLMVEEVKTSGVIYEADDKILIPYLEDLSSVHVTAQVSPHATITSINGKKYDTKVKYNMNTGATLTVTAGNGTDSKTYKISQGIPELLSSGLRESSISLLCNVDPVSMVGLPDYTNLCYVSLAGIGSQMLVGIGEGRAPFIVDAFTGSKKGEMVLGDAVADCITNDDAGHVLVCNYATGGAEAQTVNIWVTDSPTVAPTLWYSFLNPCMFPIGHRMKVLGDITSDAVIVFTAEGIAGVSTTAESAWLRVVGGTVTEIYTKDFAPLGLGWGAAPVNFATVVPASVTPDKDGWFVDYYEGNSDPSVAHGNEDCYILHYFDGRDKDNWIDLVGNWAVNPNCLDLKTFNKAQYMALFCVSHFPEWDIRPRIHFYDTTDPSSARVLMANDSISIFQKGATDSEVGAAGDVVLVPSADGYRLYLYYYDHHAQALGAYVADCFEI